MAQTQFTEQRLSLKILEGCQLHVLCCQQSMTAWDCRGWTERRHGIQKKQEQDTHRRARVKDFGEMSSVAIVALSEAQRGQIEAWKKATTLRPKVELCFSCCPFSEHREY